MFSYFRKDGMQVIVSSTITGVIHYKALLPNGTYDTIDLTPGEKVPERWENMHTAAVVQAAQAQHNHA